MRLIGVVRRPGLPVRVSVIMVGVLITELWWMITRLMFRDQGMPHDHGIGFCRISLDGYVGWLAARMSLRRRGKLARP